MERLGERIIVAASDLVGHLACGHLTELERAAAEGLVERLHYHDSALDVLVERGRRHEQRYLEGLEAEGRTVTRIVETPGAGEVAGAARTTEAAMRRGDEVIYQAAFFADGWRGRADFIIRVESPSALGPWSYEPYDAKLARHARASALTQLCTYAELIAHVQGRLPEAVHLVLGSVPARVESFRLADFIAYHRWAKNEFLARFNEPPSFPSTTTYPEPVEHCDVCRWSPTCNMQRRNDDHLSLVAGITRAQRRALSAPGTDTVAKLGSLALPVVPPFDGVGASALERIREQARLQIAGRQTGTLLYELVVPVDPGCGLAALPAPSAGDLFLDLEGDPFALDAGIEYLFGFVGLDNGETDRCYWALDVAAERRAFEQAVDFIVERRRRHPDLHIYHFASYEPAAFKRLMCRHRTRETEVDQLLRGEVFVDLHRITRQGIRASVESYSLKKLEPLYGFARAVDLRVAGDGRAQLETWLELGGNAPGADIVENVRLYNRDDCLSVRALRDWLEARRLDLSATVGSEIPRPLPSSGEASETVTARQARVEEIARRLLDGVNDDPDARSPEQQARWLLAQLLDFHRREEKSVWWDFLRLRELNDDEMIRDPAPIGGVEYVGVAGRVARSLVHRYQFPPQEHSVDEGTEVRDPRSGESLGKPIALDLVAGTIDFKRGADRPPAQVRALAPFKIVPTDAQRDALLRFGEHVTSNGLDGVGAYRAACDLLACRSPRLGQGQGVTLARERESSVDAAVRLGRILDGGVLSIQGPPGAGKTVTGAMMIVDLITSGRRVGITANSHKVISNLLGEVCRRARAAGRVVRAIQKATADDACVDSFVRSTEANAEVVTSIAANAVDIVAGTAWLWARSDLAGAVDTLFIDEAGQVSLANAVAISQAARNLVLLGDPQQLDQPTQGVHPPGADVSVLEHLLEGAATISPDRGLFLAETWRLHPDLCRFTSELFYDGRLRSRPGLDAQELRADRGLRGSGLRLLLVPHAGRQNESPEEAAAVATIFERLRAVTWINARGEEHPLRLDDVLVVAPYNAQVLALKSALPPGARVGTVDKFQGQEAPVAIYSLTTSTPEDAPRGMEFLYSPHRLNVATSRARCIAIVVASPALFRARCRTPRQMRLANSFCRLTEVAPHLTPDPQ